MKENVVEKIFGGIIVFIGIVFLIIGIWVQKDTINFQKNAEVTKGTIRKIKTYNDSEGNVLHTVYVEFYVGDERIAGPINSYSPGMHVGGTVTIYYNADNPYNFRSNGDYFIVFAIIFIVGVHFFGGFRFIINIVKNEKNIKRLIEIGQKIYAPFDRVEANGEDTYIIICKSGTSEYKSKIIWKDPTNIIKERNVTMFPIYVDPENSKNYYLSTEEIDEYLEN